MTENTEPTVVVPFKLSSIVAIAFWLMLIAQFTIEDVYAGGFVESTGYQFSAALIITLLVFSWYFVDSSENRIQRSLGLNVAMLLIAAFAAPYYRFRYFGVKRGFLFIAIVVAGVIATVFISDLLASLISGRVV